MPEPQSSSTRRHVWCAWNRDPSLTSLQRNMIKNMFLGGGGFIFSLGLIAAGATPGSDYALSAVGGSGVIIFFIVICFAEPLQKIFHELNERASSERLPLITP